MWVCPKCKREFKKTNQSHYCGMAPKTVLEYIDSQPKETHSHLRNMMITIQNSVSNIKEYILWSMPYYEKDEKTISFAACKNHISFYVGIDTIKEFESKLKDFQTKKNAIYFPYDEELPMELITEIVKWCFD